MKIKPQGYSLLNIDSQSTDDITRLFETLLGIKQFSLEDIEKELEKTVNRHKLELKKIDQMENKKQMNNQEHNTGVIEVFFKKLNDNAIRPYMATPLAGCFDLFCENKEVVRDSNLKIDYINYSTGISLEIPRGYVGLLFNRSSCFKNHQKLLNSVGVIDSDYRGEIILKMNPSKNRKEEYRPGDRIGQLMIIKLPIIVLNEKKELSNTERGNKGFGSTGKN